MFKKNEIIIFWYTMSDNFAGDQCQTIVYLVLTCSIQTYVHNYVIFFV